MGFKTNDGDEAASCCPQTPPVTNDTAGARSLVATSTSERSISHGACKEGTELDMVVGADGIARIKFFNEGSSDRRGIPEQSAVSTEGATCSVGDAVVESAKEESLGETPACPPPPGLTGVSAASIPTIQVLEHPGGDAGTLAEKLQRLAGQPRVVIRLMSDCCEQRPLEVTSGEVVLESGVPGSEKPRLNVPLVRVTGGALRLSNIAVCTTEETRVQAGILECRGCYLSSRNGCGVLCLQKAKVTLVGCEISHCMRSGLGVNGKNAEVEISNCAIVKNNFSGVGVNHQTKSLLLRDNHISGNGYHGIWLNNGVVARCIGGDFTGNKLSDKGGTGSLVNVPEEAQQALREARRKAGRRQARQGG